LGLALPAPEEIVVSAAASLREVLLELAPRFRNLTGVTATYNFGASGVLEKQIEAGAPVDVFVSAGRSQMDELQSAGLIVAESRRDVARNNIVLIVPSGNSAIVRRFADLTGEAVRRIAIGNPKTVPAGQYARQVLERMGLWEALSRRLVFGGDVRQVLEYVAREEVDAGIVYGSDARIARGRVVVSDRFPEDTHDPVLYPAAVVRDSLHKTTARRFVELIASPEGARAFGRHGFLPVDSK